jgi:hypothetical protein
MKFKCHAMTAATLLLVLAAGSNASAASDVPAEPEWSIYSLAGGAVDKFLADDEESPLWLRIYDSYARSSNPPEISIALQWPNERDGLVAKVVIAEGANFYAQAASLNDAVPPLSLNSALERVKYRRYSLTERQCPRLRSIAVAFNKLNVGFTKVPLTKGSEMADIVVRVHPRVYEVHSRDMDNLVAVHLDDGENPIALWAEAARKEVLSCSDQGSSSASSHGSSLERSSEP